MKGIRVLAVPVLVCGLAMPMTVGAQDMSFGLEETGQSRAPVKLGKPSKRLAEAMSAFDAKKFETAAMGFERVSAGKSKDGRGNRQRAQFLLGQSLYQMGYYQSALTVFDDISAEGPAHIDFGDTLEWLGLLASKLPESSGIIEKVGRYGIGALGQFKDKNPSLYNQLLYLMGRHLYAQASFRQAIDVFQEVDAKSAQYSYAKFFEGISFIRMRKSRPAIASFRAILDAIDAGDIEGVDEDRMRNLAWISLARVITPLRIKGRAAKSTAPCLASRSSPGPRSTSRANTGLIRFSNLPGHSFWLMSTRARSGTCIRCIRPTSSRPSTLRRSS